MSQPDRALELPRISIEGEERFPSYNTHFLERGEARFKLNDPTFKNLLRLNQNSPSLVYASYLISDDYGSREEQGLAERMHDLSQPDKLGDLLEWETHGFHVVGYRLIRSIEVVDRRKPIVPSEPLSSKLRIPDLRRFIPGWSPAQ